MHEHELISHQRYVEQTFSKRNINQHILNDIQGEQHICDLITEAAQRLKQWVHEPHYKSKVERLSELHTANFEDIVKDILCVTVTVTEPSRFANVVGMVTEALRMSNKIHGVKTAAEILAILSEYDFFDLFREDPEDKKSDVMLLSNIILEERTQEHIYRTKYLPPMVTSPNIVTKNYDNALLTERSSMILGKGTHHNEDICLDALNQFNQIPLTLNERLLTQLSEQPKDEWSLETKQQWETFAIESYRTYRDLIQTGNRFWLTHKYDKRGRTYAQGYHVTTQGNKFRKAIVEFADKEIIN